MKKQDKVAKVMREFKRGELKSSSGAKVTNPKQAVAIGLSEAGISKRKAGGEVKESKAMAKKEISFMKKKGAPKSMIKHEEAEYGLKKGGKVKKMAAGGATKMGAVKTAKPKMGSASSRADGVAQRGKTVGKMLRKGGMCK